MNEENTSPISPAAAPAELAAAHTAKAKELKAMRQDLLTPEEFVPMEQAARDYLKLHPDAQEVLAELALALRYQGKTDEAIAVLQYGPAAARPTRLYVIEAEILWKDKKQPDAALALLRSYSERDKDSSPANLEAQILLKEKKQPEKALALLQSCPKDKKTALTYSLEARILKEMGKNDAALAVLRECPLEIKSARLYSIEAHMLANERGQIDIAFTLLKNAPEEKKDAVIYIMMADMLWKRKKDPDTALLMLRQCPPEKRISDIYHMEAEILWKGKHQPDAALTTLKRCPQQKKRALIYNSEALLLWKEKKQPQAALDMLRTCPEQRKVPASYNIEANLLWKEFNKLDEALAVLEACPEKEAHIYNLQAEIWNAKGEKEKACGCLKQAGAMKGGGTPVTQLLTAKMLLAQRNTEGAAACLTLLLKRAPSPQAWILMTKVRALELGHAAEGRAREDSIQALIECFNGLAGFPPDIYSMRTLKALAQAGIQTESYRQMLTMLPAMEHNLSPAEMTELAIANKTELPAILRDARRRLAESIEESNLTYTEPSTTIFGDTVLRMPINSNAKRVIQGRGKTDPTNTPTLP